MALPPFLGAFYLAACIERECSLLHLASWVLFSPHLGWEGPSFVSLVFLGLFSLASLSFFKVSMVDVSLGWIILLYLETLKLPVTPWPWN